MRRSVAGVVAVAVATAGLVAAAPPADTAASSIRLQAAIARLPVRAEDTGGYDRATFTHWVDDDDDGCDTRQEVLLAEATTPPRRGPGCRLTGGAWRSLYDGKTWTNTADVDIDHVVALSEAIDSGAADWSADTRTRYANDLYPRTLRAVTDNVNQSKGDRDPGQWLPTQGRCSYIADVVAVKLRWQLSVDAAELAAIKNTARSRPNITLTVPRATIVTT